MRLTKKRADNGRYYLSGLAEVSNSYPKGYGRIQVGHAVDKLAEYEDLEEQNRLLKLPCEIKKGNIFYAIIKSKIIHLRIDDCKTNPYCGGIDIYCINTDNKCDYRWIHLPNKNIFPTKEAAEAILKELERGKEE